MAKGQSIVKLTLESQQYERNLKQAQRQFNEFVKGIGMSVPKISTMTAAIGATSAALKVMKDTFMANEEMVDEWGRTIEASKSIYQGFLNSLNNSDISGFLSRIDQIVDAARKAYDELDRLHTMRTIQAPQISAQQTENNRLQMMLRTGRYIAPQDGRAPTPGLKDGQLLTPAQIKAIENQIKGGMSKLVQLTVNEVSQSTKAINAVYNRQAKELGMTMKEFQRGTSSMQEFDRRIEGANNYMRWQQEHSFVDQSTGKLIAPRTGNPYEQYKGWNVFRVDGKRFNDLVGLVQQRDQQLSQTYSMQGQVYRTINRVEGYSPRLGGRSGGRSGGGGGGRTTIEKTETQLNNEQIDALAKSYEKASAERRESIRKEIAALQKRNEEIQKYYDIATGKVRTPTGDGKVSQLVTGPTGFATSPLTIGTLNTSRSMSELETMISGLRTMQAGSRTNAEYEGFEKSIKPLQKRLDQITGEDKKKKNEDMTVSKGVGMMVSGVSNMASGLEQLGIKVPEGMQNVLSKLQAITTILTAIETLAEVGTFLGIFHTGGVARAAGGLNVVPGNWGHDMVPALLQSGEVVLNRAQQGNLSAQLANNNAGMQLTATLRGEDIQLSINNRSRRRGRGEYVTSKFR